MLTVLFIFFVFRKRKRKAHYSFFLFTAARGPSLHWSGRNDRWVVGLGGLMACYLIRTFLRDFCGSPGIQTSPFQGVREAGWGGRGSGSIPGQRAEIPYALWPKNQNIKNRSNIVTNLI